MDYKLQTHKHELHEHLEHLGSEVHGRRVREVLVYVPEGAGGSQEAVDGGVEALRRRPVLLGADLRVHRAHVEQDARLLEGDRSLAGWHT